ncbi:hypothetical protein IMZ38_03025 [Thermosphaera chiliense]|uniref:Uncharacterized protein n=1 Tax=Thermosphaera chiliense TaxID=3402707 RepID=A0A7M1USE6_9CREN|nr:hypothetical protein [Thermosphaera aggregans]QOR94899.1 hypothetical protein IMZ38_03025 [Thermosphaera aggregans]
MSKTNLFDHEYWKDYNKKEDELGNHLNNPSRSIDNVRVKVCAFSLDMIT